MRQTVDLPRSVNRKKTGNEIFIEALKSSLESRRPLIAKNLKSKKQNIQTNKNSTETLLQVFTD